MLSWKMLALSCSEETDDKQHVGQPLIAVSVPPPGHAARDSQSPSSPTPSLRVKNTPEVCLRAHVGASNWLHAFTGDRYLSSEVCQCIIRESPSAGKPETERQDLKLSDHMRTRGASSGKQSRLYPEGWGMNLSISGSPTKI